MAKKTTRDETQLTKLQEQIVTMETNWKRALADYQNLEKRTREQQHVMAQLACQVLIEKLLPVLDHLEIASNHLTDPGLSMIVKQFIDVLDQEGVKRIEALNKTFDPALMECIEQIPGNKNTVVEVIAPGYTIADRVIRPDQVKVGNGEM